MLFTTFLFIGVVVISAGERGKEGAKQLFAVDHVSKQQYAAFMILVTITMLIPVLVWITVLAIYFTRKKIADKINKIPQFIQ